MAKRTSPSTAPARKTKRASTAKFHELTPDQQMTDIIKLLSKTAPDKAFPAKTFAARLNEAEQQEYAAQRKASQDKGTASKSTKKYLAAVAAVEKAVGVYRQQCKKLEDADRAQLTAKPDVALFDSALATVARAKNGATSIAELQRSILLTVKKRIASEIANS